MKAVHLIERSSNPRKAYASLQEEARDGGLVLDFSSGRVGAVSTLDSNGWTSDENRRWIAASEYEVIFAESTRKEYVEMVSDLGTAVVAKNKNIKGLLAYDNEFSIWWLTETSEKHAINHSLRWFMYCRAIIDSLFEEGVIEPGLRWSVWTDDPAVGELYRDAIGERGNVALRSPSGRDLNRQTKRIDPIKARIYIVYVVARAFLLSQTRKWIDRVRQRRERQDTTRKDILVVSISDTGWKRVPDPDSHPSGVEHFDSYMGHMPWDIEDERGRVSWIRSSIARHEYVSWGEKCRAERMRDASCFAALGFRAAWRIMLNTSRYISVYNALITDKRESPMWVHRDVSLDPVVLKDLWLMCSRMAVNHLVRFEQYRRAVETLRPQAVLYKSEMFIPGRLITASMKGRTRLIALQHGIHIDEAVMYQFDPRDLDERDPPDHIGHCPMPDLFAAFGDYAVQQFVEWGGFDARKVFSIGGVRHDHLVRTLHAEPENRNELRARLRARFDIPVEAPVMLLCTQQRADVGRWFNMVVDAIGPNRPDVFVAVQLHHAHGGAEDIHATAAARDFENYRIFEQATYPLIACSDVVVTGPSTIVLESILLGTPAISIAGSGSFETYPYQRERLAVTISTSSELREALARIVFAGTSEADWPRRRRVLLRRHLWNDDAGACERLLGLIHGPDLMSTPTTSTPAPVSSNGSELKSIRSTRA